MRLVIRGEPLVLKDKKRSTATTTPASSPTSIAEALNAQATPGKALHIVFVSGSEEGARWGEACAAAEAAIAGVASNWPPGAWCRALEPRRDGSLHD